MLVKLVNPRPKSHCGCSPTKKEETTMARRRHRKHGRKARRNPSFHLARRANPVNAETFKKVAVSSVVVGSLAAGVDTLLDLGIDKLAQKFPQVASFVANPYKRAVVKGGAGVLGAFGLQTMGQEVLAASVGVGGVGGGSKDAIRTFIASRSVPASLPAPAPQSAGMSFRAYQSIAR